MEYVQFLNILHTIDCSKPKIEHIPYNLIFTTKFNDSSITIISWDYLNLLLVNEYVGRHNTNSGYQE
jgi:hypothetical protein